MLQLNGASWYNDKQITGPVVFQPNPGPGYKNNWNFVEAYFQLNTIVNGIGQADGVMQYWFNGTLIIDRHDILYRTGAHPTLQFNQFLIAPYIGDGSPVDQSMFIDNLRLATSRIPGGNAARYASDLVAIRGKDLSGVECFSIPIDCSTLHSTKSQQPQESLLTEPILPTLCSEDVEQRFALAAGRAPAQRHV